MLPEPMCFKRRCKHYESVKYFGDGEETERIICTAFPRGIPNEIAYEGNIHDKPLENQGNEIVFEKENDDDFFERLSKLNR